MHSLQSTVVYSFYDCKDFYSLVLKPELEYKYNIKSLALTWGITWIKVKVNQPKRRVEVLAV